MKPCNHKWANPSVPCPNCEVLTINQAAIIMAHTGYQLLPQDKFKQWWREIFKREIEERELSLVYGGSLYDTEIEEMWENLFPKV
jgi:hypothetical protein